MDGWMALARQPSFWRGELNSSAACHVCRRVNGVASHEAAQVEDPKASVLPLPMDRTGGWRCCPRPLELPHMPGSGWWPSALRRIMTTTTTTDDDAARHGLFLAHHARQHRDPIQPLPSPDRNRSDICKAKACVHACVLAAPVVGLDHIIFCLTYCRCFSWHCALSTCTVLRHLLFRDRAYIYAFSVHVLFLLGVGEHQKHSTRRFGRAQNHLVRISNF